MLKKHQINPVIRATGVIGVVAGLVTGVTFAALQSQATLTNNTIASATANLEVSSSVGCGADSGTFSQLEPGFAFTGIVPGGTDSGPKAFCLRNAGTANMSLNVKVPTLPTFTVLPSGTVDNSQVVVAISCAGPIAVTQSLDILGGVSGANLSGTLAAGTTVACTATVSMTSTAFTGSSASTNNFDFTFTGSGV